MVMMAVKLLVKMAVMMMAPGGTPAPPEARGRGAPFFFFFLLLDLPPLDGRRVSPLVLGLHGMGGARSPPRLDMSLCLSLFPRVATRPQMVKSLCFSVIPGSVMPTHTVLKDL